MQAAFASGKARRFVVLLFARGRLLPLLLDGQDVALLRAEVVDAHGHLVTGANASAVNVTFAVDAGPARVVASHNGDPTCHDPNLSPSHTAFHGLVRGVVQVTHDAASPAHHRRRLTQIDLDGNRRTTIAAPGEQTQTLSARTPTSIVAPPTVVE